MNEEITPRTPSGHSAKSQLIDKIHLRQSQSREEKIKRRQEDYTVSGTRTFSQKQLPKKTMFQRMLELTCIKDKRKSKQESMRKQFEAEKLQLEFFMNVSTRSEIMTSSEVGWITKNNLILTLNNDYYLIKLNHKDLVKVRGGLAFGRQQVTSSTFCSLVRRPNKYSHHRREGAADSASHIG